MSSVRVVAILLFAFVAGLQAQTNGANPRPVSLRDCIAWALDRNLSVLIARDSADIARFTLKASQGLYDPVFSLSGRDVFVNVPSQFDAKKIGIGVEYEEQLVSFGPGLSGRLPFGFTYALSSISTYEHAHSTFSTNFFDPTADIFIDVPGGVRNSNAWFNVTGVSVVQPLLKDFWIDIYRRDIELNRKKLQISKLLFQEVLIDTIASVERVYYDVTLAREEVKVQQKSLTVASQLLTEVRKQVQVGTLADLDAKQAESAVETARSLVAGAEGNYAVQKNNLKNLLAGGLQQWSGIEIEPSDPLTVLHEPANLQESWFNAMAKRPELLAMRLIVESSDVNLRYFYNQLFPALNLTGTYGFYTFNHSFSGHLDELKHGANAYYSAGVVLSFPLGNRQARYSYKGGKVAKQQAALGVSQLERRIMTEVQNSVTDAAVSFSQIASTRKAREFAQQALDSQIKQFKAGNTNSFIVLEFERNLTIAQSVELRSVADYNKAKANVALSEGTTLERHKINLKVH